MLPREKVVGLRENGLRGSTDGFHITLPSYATLGTCVRAQILVSYSSEKQSKVPSRGRLKIWHFFMPIRLGAGECDRLDGDFVRLKTRGLC